MEKCSKYSYCVFPPHTKKSTCKAANAFHFSDEYQEIFCCPKCQSCSKQKFKTFIREHGQHLSFLKRKVKRQMLRCFEATQKIIPTDEGCQSVETYLAEDTYKTDDACQTEEVCLKERECQTVETYQTDDACQTEEACLKEGACQTEEACLKEGACQTKEVCLKEGECQSVEATFAEGESQTAESFQTLILKQIGYVFKLLNEDFNTMKMDISNLTQNLNRMEHSMAADKIAVEKKKSNPVKPRTLTKRKSNEESSTSKSLQTKRKYQKKEIPPPLIDIDANVDEVRKYQKKEIPPPLIVIDVNDDDDEEVDLDKNCEEELDDDDETDRLFKALEPYF